MTPYALLDALAAYEIVLDLPPDEDAPPQPKLWTVFGGVAAHVHKGKLHVAVVSPMTKQPIRLEEWPFDETTTTAADVLRTLATLARSRKRLATAAALERALGAL